MQLNTRATMPRGVNLGLLVTMHRYEMAGCVEGL